MFLEKPIPINFYIGICILGNISLFIVALKFSISN